MADDKNNEQLLSARVATLGMKLPMDSAERQEAFELVREVRRLEKELARATIELGFTKTEIDATVSVGWVLNELAGMTFPGQGEAHDYIQALFINGSTA